MGRGRLERAGVALIAAAAASCTPPPRMCASGGAVGGAVQGGVQGGVQGECGTTSSCVAGRCVAHGAVVAVMGARRLVYDPVQVGYVRRGAPSAGGPPAVAALGGSGVAFLRFAVDLPPEATVLEAYVLLDRAAGVDAVDAAPEPVTLHLAPVVDGWDERSLSWAVQPRVEEIGAPVTRVLPAAAGPIRLDVRAIVERWRRAGRDAGVAVLGGGERAAGALGRGGALFALGPSALGASGPRLELYVR